MFRNKVTLYLTTYSQMVQKKCIHRERTNGKVNMVNVNIWETWYTEIIFFAAFL